MTDKDDQNQALKFAMKLLGLRQRSVFELAKRLEQKGFEENIISRTIKELDGFGYMDDEKFAECFINDETNLKNHGRILIIKRLKEKGIAEKIINEKIRELLGEEKELDLAKKTMQKKLKTLDKDMDKNKLYRKLSFYLHSRGYPSNIIGQILKNDIE